MFFREKGIPFLTHAEGEGRPNAQPRADRGRVLAHSIIISEPIIGAASKVLFYRHPDTMKGAHHSGAHQSLYKCATDFQEAEVL